jgi:formylglycine-generating enzyme required for sulfatase activity
MIPVKGGKFKLGGEVELDDFYVGKYPVTQELWEAVMGNNPAYFKNNPKNPVERVSWEDTQDFIKKLNQKTGKNYRLLTEAEWEYAARGGSKSKGFEYAGSNNIGEVAWYFGNSKNQTQKVGQKKANELGIHDMNGNVWEWCQDWYGDYMKFSQINPLGPKNGATRVLRGGGWGNNAIRCQILLRNKRKPSYHDDIIGLRLAHN